jgi:glucosamine kinase
VPDVTTAVQRSIHSRFVVAIDAGGTHTRVGCFGLDGSLLGSATGTGGGPNHNDDAAAQVSAAVGRAIAVANLDPADAAAVAAGVAGFGFGERADLAGSFLDLAGLSCPTMMVNDAVIAHRGALLGLPGVIIVAGTGSMILGITASGEQIPSGLLGHYAGGARHLVFDAMHRVLLDTAADDDADLIRLILEHWQVADVSDLRRRMVDLNEVDRNEVKRRYGALAPVVMSAADTSPLAAAAVAALAGRTADGVRLLAPLIGTDPVEVALAGSLATAPAFVRRLESQLCQDATKTRIVPPALDPLQGAAVIAYELAAVPVDDGMIARLRNPSGLAVEIESAGSPEVADLVV